MGLLIDLAVGSAFLGFLLLVCMVMQAFEGVSRGVDRFLAGREDER